MSKKRSHRNHGRPADSRGGKPQGPAVAAQAMPAQHDEQPGDANAETVAVDAMSDIPIERMFGASAVVDAPESFDQAAAVDVMAPDPAPQATISAMPERDPRADIRGVLIQVAGARLLLPNATIAEVLSYADPDPVGGDAPAWLLGRMRWRGWHLPLIAFGRMAGMAEERAGLGNKVVVLKAIAGNAKTPYVAMLTQGFPRLVTVAHEALRLDDAIDPQTLPRGVQARVFLNEDEALLPDLEAIEALVADAVDQAA